ncbi:hypothetical protein ACNKHT_14365 [Shigella flexneri]
MVVTNENIVICEKKWNIPSGTIPAKIGLDAVAQDRALKDGKLNVYWTMCTNNTQAGRTSMKSVCRAGAIRATSSSSPIRTDSRVRWPPT